MPANINATELQLESLHTVQISVVVISGFCFVFTGDRDAEFGEKC